jgi:hypothetical protein
MAGIIYHRNAELIDIHIPYAFLYSSEEERENADGFSSSDIGKLCRVTHPKDQLYMLINNQPPTWNKIGSNIEPATNNTIGGVIVQQSGGLSIDSVGNLIIRSDLLNKLVNLPSDFAYALASTNEINPGTDLVGFKGHSATNFVVVPGSLTEVISNIINKISQNAQEIYQLLNSPIPQATDMALGGIKVTNGTTSGLNLDQSTGQLKIHDDFLTKLNDFDTILNSYALKSELLSSSGSHLIGYDGHSGNNGQFSLSQSRLDEALDLIVDKIDMLDLTGGNIGYASETVAGVIKIGDGLDIDSIGGVCSVDLSEKSLTELADVPSYSSYPAGYVLAINDNRNGTEWVSAPSGSGTSGSDEHLFVYKISTDDFNTPSSWTLPDGWSLTLNGNDASFTHNVNGYIVDWSGVVNNTTGDPRTFIVPSGNSNLLLDSSTEFTITELAPKVRFDLYIQFWDEGNLAEEPVDVYTIVVNDYAQDNITIPPGTSWSVTRNTSDGSLVINHGMTKDPFNWSGFDLSSSPNSSIIHTFMTNLLVSGTGTCIFAGASSLGSFKLTLMFK